MKKILYLLGQMNDADVEWIISHGKKERIARGTILVHKGQPIAWLYILLDGTLEVRVGGDQAIQLGCGEVIGEISFVDSRPPNASVAAATDAVVLAIARTDLTFKLQSDVGFAARFFHSLAVCLAQRLRSTTGLLGYGKGQALDEASQYEDELGPETLDTMHMAASRFDQVLRRMLAQ